MSEDKKKDKGEEKIVTFTGKVIGVKKTDKNGKTTVTDWNGKNKGSADKGGTRDFLGRRIVEGNHPDILANEDDE